MKVLRLFLPSLLLLGGLFGYVREAHAYVHIVQAGESLADIAQAAYGDPKKESLLSGANGLDGRGGAKIVPGQRLEVPAPGYVRAARGDTWPDLAQKWLGHRDRSALLSQMNGTLPWLPPAEGREIVLPAVVVHIATEGEGIGDLAKRYWGDVKRAWEINSYNLRKDEALKLGEVLLVPVPDLTLTERGREEARQAGAALAGEGASSNFALQKRVDEQLTHLLGDLRAGRYIEVATRGSALASSGELSRAQLLVIYRSLVEAYVALDAKGAATAACRAWRSNVDRFALDPKLVSPKIIMVCTR
ncbi:MAG: LysM domain-containing protein [Polyangiaceae bacterium]